MTLFRWNNGVVNLDEVAVHRQATTLRNFDRTLHYSAGGWQVVANDLSCDDCAAVAVGPAMNSRALSVFLKTQEISTSHLSPWW